MEYNGAAMVAMTGKNCVAIAADRRLGAQAQTVSCDFQKLFQMGPTLFVGLPGLATDVLTMCAMTWSSTYALANWIYATGHRSSILNSSCIVFERNERSSQKPCWVLFRLLSTRKGKRAPELVSVIRVTFISISTWVVPTESISVVVNHLLFHWILYLF